MNRHLLSKNSGRGNVLMNIYACELGRKTLRALESRRAGLTACLDLTTSEEHVFRKGDFYVIEPGVVYAQKSAPGTEILFIKVPPGNDKVPVDTTPEVEAWFREPIKE